MSYKYTPEEIAGHRAAWYAFLRENPERQGYSWLHKLGVGGTDRLCCLGAGCAVLVERGVKMKVEREDDFVTYDGKNHFPPYAFVAAMELPERNPEIEINGKCSRASHWNDYGTPWATIADALEAAYPADAEAIRQAREAA